MLRTSSSGGLGQERGYNFKLSFSEGPVLVQLFVPFFGFFFCCLVMSFSFFLRLKSSLQKNNLSRSKYGYRGFFFLSQAVRLWFVVLSKLPLVSLDYYIILFQPG